MGRSSAHASLPNSYTRGKSLVGVGMVLCIVVLFSLNSQVMAGLTARKGHGEPRVSPFLIIWLCHACLGAFLPAHAAYTVCYRQQLSGGAWLRQLRGLLGPRTAAATLGLSAVYMLQNWAFVKALEFSSVTVDTAIYQCVSIWVFLLSVAWLGESAEPRKVAAVALSVAGVLLISASGVGSGGGAGGAGGAAGGLRQNELAGAGLALLSTLAGAGYQVVFKGYCGALSTGGVFLFLGLMGLAHLAVLWLFMPLLHVTGVERFVWPSARQWGVLELTSLVALCVNTLCMFTIHICSPLFLSVGMALTVPASYLCDLALGNIDALRLPTLGGVLLDTAGFVLLSLSGSGQRSGTAADGIALRQVPYAAVATSDAHSDDDEGRDSDRDSTQ